MLTDYDRLRQYEKCDVRAKQCPPKVLEQQGQFLCFCNKLNIFGVEKN